MLIEAVAAALPDLRALAESLMVDACTVTGPVSQTWDEPSGSYVPGAAVTAYAGPCRVQRLDGPPARPSAGDTAWDVGAVIVSLPVAGSGAVRVGHRVTVTACAMDGELVDAVFDVVAVLAKTFATARRLACQEVTHG